jgi:hypothetical protein
MSFKAIIGVFLLFVAVGCKKNKCDECENVKLYYQSSCATINGYVEFDNSEIAVFRDELDNEFHGSGVTRCISYSYVDDEILTSDCQQGKIIKIDCIK